MNEQINGTESLEIDPHMNPMNNINKVETILQVRGVKLIFTRGHISLEVAFKGPDVILGLCKCNYSLTRGKELAQHCCWVETRWRALSLPPVL